MKKIILFFLTIPLLLSIASCKKDNVVPLEDKIAGKWSFDKLESYFEPADPVNSDTTEFGSSEYLNFVLPSGVDANFLYNFNNPPQEKAQKWTKINESNFTVHISELPTGSDTYKVIEFSATKLVLKNEYSINPTKKVFYKLTLSKPYTP